MRIETAALVALAFWFAVVLVHGLYRSTKERQAP
jgi:hypothetical protein